MSLQDAETFIRRWLDDHGLNRKALADHATLLTVIAAYGVECARRERERCAQAIQVLIDKDRALGDLTAAILHTEAQNIVMGDWPNAGEPGASPGG